jgi:hypothetical protein
VVEDRWVLLGQKEGVISVIDTLECDNRVIKLRDTDTEIVKMQLLPIDL